MIHLDKEVAIIKPTETTSSNEKKGNIPPREVYLFAQKVLQKMQNDKVAPTPYSFQIYFETMLEKSNTSLKYEIECLRENEVNVNNSEHLIEIEKEIKEGFSSIKSMVQSISTSYKNIAYLKQYIKKTDGQLTATNNKSTIVNIITSLKSDIEKFDALIASQLHTLKSNYEKTVFSLKSMEEKSIFDTRFDIYNKKYLLHSLRIEQTILSKQKHKSSLMAIKIKDSVLSTISGNQNQFLLKKNVAKLLQKTSRRSDIVAHYGSGMFFILMKYTNIEEVKLACQRVAALIYGSSFFIGGADIRMDLEIAATDIDENISIEESIALLINSLPLSSRDGLKYKIIQAYKEE